MQGLDGAFGGVAEGGVGTGPANLQDRLCSDLKVGGRLVRSGHVGCFWEMVVCYFFVWFPSGMQEVGGVSGDGGNEEMGAWMRC